MSGFVLATVIIETGGEKQADFDLKQNRAVLTPYFAVENETECLFLDFNTT